MVFSGAIEAVGREWAVIGEAPFSFAASVAVVGTLIWIALRWQYGARLDRRDDEIAALKSKVASSSDDADPHAPARHMLIGRLTHDYLQEHPDAPRRVRLGLEEPPAEWFNENLKKLGEDWRVRTNRHGKLEIYEPARWG